MKKNQLSLIDASAEKISTPSSNAASLIQHHSDDQAITFDEIFLGQTSIVAPDSASLDERTNQDTGLTYLVKKYNHLVCTQAGDLRSVKMEIETMGSQGLTDYFDDRVILALHTLALKKDHHTYKTNISEIASTLSLPLNGEYISRIRSSLEKLNSTTIWSEQFIDPETNEPVTQRVHMLPQYKLYRDEVRSRVVKRNGVLFDEKIVYKKDFTIEINQFFFKSLKKQKILLDIGVLNTFRNKTVEKFYRFLNTVFHSQSTIDLDLEEFCEVVGVARPKYISNIKRNIYVRYIKEMEDNRIIQPFDIKHNFYRKDKVWRVVFERGEHYAVLKDRFEMKPYLFDIFSFLHYTLGMKKQEAHGLMEQHSAEELHNQIHYLRLAMKITPKQIRYPKAWLKKALSDNWDHSASLEILKLMDQQKTPFTAYQRSWDKKDMNEQERRIFHQCVNELDILEAMATRWIKLHQNFDYIERLATIKDKLKPEEQRPEYLVTMIRTRDARVWRISVDGSEHARQQLAENDVRHGGGNYEDIKQQQRDTYTPLFETPIAVEAVQETSHELDDSDINTDVLKGTAAAPSSLPPVDARDALDAQFSAPGASNPPGGPGGSGLSQSSQPPVNTPSITAAPAAGLPLGAAPGTGDIAQLATILKDVLGPEYPSIFSQTFLEVSQIFANAGIQDQDIVTQTTLQKMKAKYSP